MGAAAAECDRGLREFPRDINMLVLAARVNMLLRQFDASQNMLDSAIRIHPDFALAHDVLGDLRLAQGSFKDALDAYEHTLKLDPTRDVTQQKIARANDLMARRSNAGFDTGAGDGRIPRGKMAFAEEVQRAEALQRDDKQDEAEAIYRNILRKDPDHVEASRLLAGIASAHEQYAEAEVFLLHAVELAPDYPRAWVDLTNVQRLLEKFDESIESATRVIELAPDMAESFILYGSAVGAAGRQEEAIESFEKALQLAPNRPSALCGMGHHLKTIGRQDEAINRYRACIAIQADHAEAYWSLANLKTFRFEEAEVVAMRKLLERHDLPDESRAQIHNALGLEFEARKDYDQAFTNFEHCNIVRRKAEFYDPVDTESTHDRVIELFTEEFLKQPSGDVVEPTPIFVVGLPRSGSTLIEQILASHSMVEGTHELGDLSKSLRSLRQAAPQHDKRFPDTVAPLKAPGWSRIGAEYIERTAKHRHGSAFFVDKNPNNFIFVGLLKLAMPNAKIINARRHPLDSCLGSYKQLFASGQPFSYDITELGEYYLQYQRLMDHWHSVLPGFALDVHYEDVVGDLEMQVRRILDYCGLPFEEACLRFHETARAVKTASSEQVRQPIYSSSVDLWRNYEHRLETLIHIMEPMLIKLDKSAQPSLLLRTKPNHA